MFSNTYGKVTRETDGSWRISFTAPGSIPSSHVMLWLTVMLMDEYDPLSNWAVLRLFDLPMLEMLERQSNSGPKKPDTSS